VDRATEADVYAGAGEEAGGAPAASRAAGLGEWVTLLVLALTALAADQVSKATVRAELPLGERAEGLGWFDFHHVRNSGIVRGLFQGTALPLAIVTALVVVGMLVYFARNGASRRALPIAFGFLVGGSLGNLADRLRLGYVTDFVDSPSGGTFNLADVSIMAGLAILLATLLLGRPAPVVR
jgi:signal peptidase II